MFNKIFIFLMLVAFPLACQGGSDLVSQYEGQIREIEGSIKSCKDPEERRFLEKILAICLEQYPTIHLIEDTGKKYTAP